MRRARPGVAVGIVAALALTVAPASAQRRRPRGWRTRSALYQCRRPKRRLVWTLHGTIRLVLAGLECRWADAPAEVFGPLGAVTGSVFTRHTLGCGPGLSESDRDPRAASRFRKPQTVTAAAQLPSFATSTECLALVGGRSPLAGRIAWAPCYGPNSMWPSAGWPASWKFRLAEAVTVDPVGAGSLGIGRAVAAHRVSVAGGQARPDRVG
jgi:hypothetical protein